MAHHAKIRLSEKGRNPPRSAFCRTRRPITTTVRVSRPLWLLWLKLTLQLSTILLVLAGPAPLSPRLPSHEQHVRSGALCVLRGNAFG